MAFSLLCAFLLLFSGTVLAGEKSIGGNTSVSNPKTFTHYGRAARSVPTLVKAADPGEDFRLYVETDLVVLHTTVVDKKGNPVTDLTREHFRVYENQVKQQLKIFKREDIPVSVGIVVDNSGSMRDKRKEVNAAALKFVQSSHPLDEVFIMNFKYEAFLDTDFTNDIKLLEKGMEKIDSRGGTALYGAIDTSLQHLRDKGTRDKKVLLVITDGEDTASRLSLKELLNAVQRTDAIIYTVGLLGEKSFRSVRISKRALEAISRASGGKAYFPQNLRNIQSVATSIAGDIRNQYVLAYSPANLVKDGNLRKVEVAVNAPKKYGELSVRTRTGYHVDTP